MKIFCIEELEISIQWLNKTIERLKESYLKFMGKSTRKQAIDKLKEKNKDIIKEWDKRCEDELHIKRQQRYKGLKIQLNDLKK